MSVEESMEAVHETSGFYGFIVITNWGIPVKCRSEVLKNIFLRNLVEKASGETLKSMDRLLSRKKTTALMLGLTSILHKRNRLSLLEAAWRTTDTTLGLYAE